MTTRPHLRLAHTFYAKVDVPLPPFAVAQLNAIQCCPYTKVRWEPRNAGEKAYAIIQAFMAARPEGFAEWLAVYGDAPGAELDATLISVPLQKSNYEVLKIYSMLLGEPDKYVPQIIAGIILEYLVARQAVSQFGGNIATYWFSRSYNIPPPPKLVAVEGKLICDVQVPAHSTKPPPIQKQPAKKPGSTRKRSTKRNS